MFNILRMCSYRKKKKKKPSPCCGPQQTQKGKKHGHPTHVLPLNASKDVA